MVESLTPNVGGGPIGGPPLSQWTPAYPTRPVRRPTTWPALAASGIAATLAVCPRIVTLVRPTASVPLTTVPAYACAAVLVAQRELCDTYDLAARSVRVETNATDRALARVALSNAASQLDSAAANTAVDGTHRDAASALAAAYRAVNALASVATAEQYRASVDGINAKGAATKKVCSGG